MGMARRQRDAEAELNLPPGFRFHPTDEELVVHYLCRKAAEQRLPVPIIAEVDLYKFDPWDLPEKALFGQREWYFFTPRDRKYPNGSRPNRAAGRGYWKATGADKPVASGGAGRVVGIKKALVFYSGKPPRGVKTDWIMHEYRLADAGGRGAAKKGTLRLDDWVLCRLYNKKNEWEKIQKEREEKEMVAEHSWDDSLHTRTPESEIDNDPFPELDSFPAFRDAAAETAMFAPQVPKEEVVEEEVKNGWFMPKEEEVEEEKNGWFMDLTYDDIQGMYSGLDMPAADDFFSSVFASPGGKMGQQAGIAPF